MSTKIISIGYEKRDITEVLEILNFYRVKKLLDIRELPISRKKNFSKKALSKNLNESDIQYYHLQVAGNPYRKEKNNIEQCLNLYSLYLKANPKVIETVIEYFSDEPIAILCYERESINCHRSVLLQAIQKKGYQIEIIDI